MLVPGEDNSDVDVARVRLLLPQKVVNSSFNISAKARLLKFLGGEAVFFLLCSGRFVATLAFEPKKR